MSWPLRPVWRGLFVVALAGLVVARTRAAGRTRHLGAADRARLGSIHAHAGRFAVLLIVPLALLAGRAATRYAPRVWRALAVVLALAAAALNDMTLWRLVRAERAKSPFNLPDWFGQTEAFAGGQLRAALPADARAWLVGDARAFYLPPLWHYTVVFSRDPWLEYAAGHCPSRGVGVAAYPKGHTCGIFVAGDRATAADL